MINMELEDNLENKNIDVSISTFKKENVKTKQSEKKSKLAFFKEMITIFKSLFTPFSSQLIKDLESDLEQGLIEPKSLSTINESQDKKQSQEHQELSTKFDLFLKSDMFLFSTQLVSNGYTPSNKQKEILWNELTKELINSPLFILELKKVMPNVSNDLLETWLIHHFTIFQKNIYWDDFSFIKEKFNDSNFGLTIFTNYISNIPSFTKQLLSNIQIDHPNIGAMNATNKHNRQQITSFYQKFNEIHCLIKFLNDSFYVPLESVLQYRLAIKESKETILNFLDKINVPIYSDYHIENKEILKISIFDSLLNNLDELLSNNFDSDKQKFILQANTLNREAQLTQNIKEKIIHDFDNFNQQLPKAAITLLNSIHLKYNSLYTSEKDVSISFHDIDNLYIKELPLILKKYVSIDPDYRSNMKHINGKNAQELMLLSLNDILHALEEKNIEVNEYKLSDLSVSQRKTRELKNKMN